MPDAGPAGAEGRAHDARHPGQRVDGLLPAQRAAVEAPGGVAVVAGAGTGKTHMLAHRYLKHVRDGLDPLSIVAVTFTERAAAELRARIRELLVASLPPDSPEALTVEAAQISTMHALAQRICQEFPEAAGVPPDFTILDDLEGSVWLAEQVEEAMSELPPALFDAAPYGAVRETVAKLLADPVIADAAFEHDSSGWPALVAAARVEALTSLTTSAAWEEAVTTVRAVTGPDGDRREETRRVAEAALDLLDSHAPAAGTRHEASADADQGQSPEVRAALEQLSAIDLRGGSKGRYPDGDFALLGDALKHLRAAVRAALDTGLVVLELGEVDERLARLLPDLKAAYGRIRDRLAARKRERRVLDFADLEVHALRALEDPAVVAHYQARWRALLVDEFQDTNAVQELILDRLAGSMTVTVVGDEKQSIYGFRGAKSEVFERYRRRVVERGGSEVVLAASFRSHAGLLTDINGVFAPLLGGAHQELVPTRDAGPGVGPFTSLLVVEKGDVKANRQVSEARALADTLKRLVDDGVLIHDKGSGGSRALRYGDIAVLARNWQALGVYGEVLPALGVPAVHTGGGNLLALREVQDGIALLRFLAGPDDDVALAAVLRSPYFAVDDAMLYHLAAHRAARDRETDAHVSLWEALTSYPDATPAAAVARDVLSDLMIMRDTHAPSALLRAADAATGYDGVLAGLPGGRRRLADHDGLRDLVRHLESGSEDLFTLWRRLRGLVRADLQVARPKLAAEGAVTLLTVHSSKGLEWPVVVVADLERRERSQRDAVLIDADAGVALRMEDDDGESVEPALYTILRTRAAERRALEERRLLYVALTRARDRLVLSSASESGGALDVLEPGLMAAGVQRTVVAHQTGSARMPTPAAHEAGPSEQSLDDSVVGALEASRPVTAPDEDERWAEVHDLVAQLDDGWSRLAGALAGAGVRAPAPELAGRWLRGGVDTDSVDAAAGDATSGGPTAAAYVLLGWRVAGAVLVVTEGPTGAGGVSDRGVVAVTRRPRGAVAAGDETVRVWSLHVDPYGDVDAAVALVVEALAAVGDKADG